MTLHNHSPRTMRRSFVLVLTGILLVGCFAPALAQIPQFYFGLATGGNAIPFSPNTSTSWQKYQGFYNAGLFTGAYPGVITKVYWQRYQATTGTTYTNVGVHFGQSTATTFSTTAWFSPMTQCFSAASYTVPAGNTGDWFSIQLQTPYYYNPNQTLIVQFCSEGVSAGTGFSVMDGAAAAVTNLGRLYGGPLGCSTAAPAGSTTNYRQNFGFDLSSPYINDAGISAVLSPVNFCAGTYPIQVNLKNYGTATLNTVSINWTYDGVPQPAINWTTPIASLGDAPITLSPATAFGAGVPHTLKVWTSNPNSAVDSAKLNDTLFTTLKPALSGTFTIGGASPNYPTLGAAAADISANGICGPVVFNIRSGTYPEQVNIGTISGASATNTVTFQSETGNRADVTVTYSATLSGAASATVAFNGCDYVTFRNMTIVSTGATYGYTLYFAGGCDYNKILNCNVRTVNSTSSSHACLYNPSGSIDNYNEFRDNLFEYGYYSVYWYGSSTTSRDTRTIFDNNTFLNFYYYGLLMYYQDAPQITRNVVQTNSTQTNYGMYMYYNYNDRVVSGNKIIFTGSGYKYGMMNYYCTGTSIQSGLVTNNFVTLSSAQTGYYPTYIYYNDYNNYYNNSFYNATPTTSYYGAYIYYGSFVKLINNIFYHAGGGYAVYCAPGTNVTASNYNLYFSSGSTLAYWNTTCTNLAALQAATGRDQNSVNKTVNFANPTNGDLHLVGASQDDPALTGTMLPEVTIDIDGEPRARPYIGADEGCYITPGAVTFDVVDANGNPVSYFNYPGTIYVKYYIAFPASAFTATITLNFYTVPGNALSYTTNFTVNKLAGITAQGVQAVSIPTMTSGYYRVEGIFNTRNSCDLLTNYKPGDKGVLALAQGQTPCVVWPGDATNNGVVDYGDRSALNKYIQLANLSPTWLQGPARYRADYATNPFTYYTWVGQASAPWATPEGCYMDTDGSGAVNSLDYIAMRVNWLRTWGAPPKSASAIQPGTFDMAQNYPNPFGATPTTSISYSVPERSQVRLVVTDMLGRIVATLVDGSVQAGLHLATFDASALNSGQYIATVTMTGDSGLSFSKSVTMTLSK